MESPSDPLLHQACNPDGGHYGSTDRTDCRLRRIKGGKDSSPPAHARRPDRAELLFIYAGRAAITNAFSFSPAHEDGRDALPDAGVHMEVELLLVGRWELLVLVLQHLQQLVIHCPAEGQEASAERLSRQKARVLCSQGEASERQPSALNELHYSVLAMQRLCGGSG
ncbi:hypothetical protein AOLI_G00313540 [Acnodon oligacanthus]